MTDDELREHLEAMPTDDLMALAEATASTLAQRHLVGAAAALASIKDDADTMEVLAAVVAALGCVMNAAVDLDDRLRSVEA